MCPEWITGGLGSATSQVMGFFSSCFIIFTPCFAYFAQKFAGYALQGIFSVLKSLHMQQLRKQLFNRRGWRVQFQQRHYLCEPVFAPTSGKLHGAYGPEKHPRPYVYDHLQASGHFPGSDRPKITF